MKKLVTALLATFIILTSCSNSGEKYTLKPNMKAGESYTMDYKIDFDQEVMGINNKILMSMSHLMKIKNVNAQQDMEMDFMYTRMVMEMKSPMFSVSYDSDSTYLPGEPGDSEDPAAMSETMRKVYANSMGKLVNKPIEVTMDAAGQVKQVKGYKELVSSIQDSMNTVSGANNPQLNDMMSEDQIKQTFQQTFGTFPKKPVAIGEDWTNEINMNQSGMLMKYTNTYKIVEILKKENEAIIDVKGIISVGIDPAKTAMKVDLKGTLTGRLVVDMNSGLVKTGKQNMDIKMDMEVMGKKVPMTMKGTATLTGKKL